MDPKHDVAPSTTKPLTTSTECPRCGHNDARNCICTGGQQCGNIATRLTALESVAHKPVSVADAARVTLAKFDDRLTAGEFFIDHTKGVLLDFEKRVAALEAAVEGVTDTRLCKCGHEQRDHMPNDPRTCLYEAIGYQCPCNQFDPASPLPTPPAEAQPKTITATQVCNFCMGTGWHQDNPCTHCEAHPKPGQQQAETGAMCLCGHTKYAHYGLEDKCDECDCNKYQPDKSGAEVVVSDNAPASRPSPSAPASARYVTRTCEIEALQWTGSNLEELRAFVPESFRDNRIGVAMGIKTLEGVMTVSEGDYIIKGLKGEFYPCKPDIFALKYQPAPVPNESATGVGTVLTERERAVRANLSTVTRAALAVDPKEVVAIIDRLAKQALDYKGDIEQWAKNESQLKINIVTIKQKLAQRERELSVTTMERNTWKANHDEMVARNKLLRDRPDLPIDMYAERMKWHETIQQLQDELSRLRSGTWTGRVKTAGMKVVIEMQRYAADKTIDLSEVEWSVDRLRDALASTPDAAEPRTMGVEALPRWWAQFILNVSELDRTSPEDEPDVMLATDRELSNCAINAIEAGRGA